MLSPKDQFVDTPEAKEFAKILERPEFERAITVALAQMCLQIPSSTDPAVGAHSAATLEGARRFIAILTTLPSKPNRTSPVTGLEREEPVN